jgi:TRAP transporter TAXI family solute receptor
MNRRKLWIVAMISVVLGIVLGVGFYGHRVGRWKSVTILTATKGGTYYPLGKGLAQVLKQLPGTPIKDANAVQTDGSIANIESLLNKEDNVVAFTMASDLVRNTEAKEKLRILARLYQDVMQIVVRTDAGIKTIENLKDKRVFLGPTDSGTRRIARVILSTVELSGPDDYNEIEANSSFEDAADKLINEELDAAFFMAGTPTEAVQKALASGDCELLGLDPNTLISKEQDSDLGLDEHEIREEVYGKYQKAAITTIASDVLLICHSRLDEGLAAVIVKGLFYNTERLEFAHSKALEIKLKYALDVEDLPVDRHPGVKKFLDETLLIATGSMNGYYYRLGKKIQEQLEAWHIPAVTIHTDGSFENAKLLSREDWHAIAIMQYDAALAAKYGNLKAIYNVDLEDLNISYVKGISRIATLHEEKVHVIIRKTTLDKIKKNVIEKDPNSETEISHLDQLCDALETTKDKIDICVGPEDSGTQAIARAVIKLHHLEDYTNPLPLSVSDMVDRLHAETLDAGFFVSHVPTGAFRSVVEDADAFSLLSLGPRERGQMQSCVFKMSRIEPETYGQDEVINTIATRAVLVTTEDLPARFPVRDITEAIFDGEAYLGIEGLTKETMAERLPSLPLHPGAEKHYKTEDVLGLKPPPMHWLRKSWTILGCLTMLLTVMLIPGYTGLIILRRNRTTNEIGRRILAIPLEASTRDSVQRLLKIRDEIQERVRRRWWRWGELDKHRWRYLRDLIHDRIGEAKENLTRAFVVEIRAVVNDREMDETGRRQRYRAIEDRILEYFEKAELDPSQQKMLRELLRERGQQHAKAKESKGGKNHPREITPAR